MLILHIDFQPPPVGTRPSPRLEAGWQVPPNLKCRDLACGNPRQECRHLAPCLFRADLQENVRRIDGNELGIGLRMRACFPWSELSPLTLSRFGGRAPAYETAESCGHVRRQGGGDTSCNDLPLRAEQGSSECRGKGRVATRQERSQEKSGGGRLRAGWARSLAAKPSTPGTGCSRKVVLSTRPPRDHSGSRSGKVEVRYAGALQLETPRFTERLPSSGTSLRIAP